MQIGMEIDDDDDPRAELNPKVSHPDQLERLDGLPLEAWAIEQAKQEQRD